MTTADAWEEVLSIENGQRHFCLPGESGHGCDRGKVIASNVRQFLDEVNKIGCLELIHTRGILLDECLIAGQEFCAPLTHEQLDTELCSKRHCHGHATRMEECLRQCVAQEPPEHIGAARREEVERAEVPAVDDDVHRPRGWDAGKLSLVGEQPFLEPQKPPAFEQRRHRIAQPLAEPDMACPGTGLRGFPCHRLRQGSNRAGLEECHLTSS